MTDNLKTTEDQRVNGLTKHGLPPNVARLALRLNIAALAVTAAVLLGTVLVTGVKAAGFLPGIAWPEVLLPSLILVAAHLLAAASAVLTSIASGLFAHFAARKPRREAREREDEARYQAMRIFVEGVANRKNLR